MPFKTVITDESYLKSHFYPTKMEVHANGLCHPGHMEWTQDGRLLVSEFGRGRIVDITEGGDCRDAKPFAFGLQHPAGIITNYEGNRIIVADSGRDAIVDITDGGDASNAPIILSGIPAPYGMVVFQNKLFATYTNRETNGLTEVPDSSVRGARTFALTQAHAPAFPLGVSEHPYYLGRSGACGSWTGVVAGNRLLLAQSTFGIIWDVTERGQFDGNKHKRFAFGLTKPVGMIYHPELDFVFVAASGTGCVKAIPNAPETDMRFVPPIITGLKEPRCVRFAKDSLTMFVCDMSSCCVWRIELRRY